MLVLSQSVTMTWDNANKGANVALTNGLLTATSTNAGSQCSRATLGYLAGTGITRASWLKYFELTVVAPGSGDVGLEVGIMSDAEVFTNFLGETGNSVSLNVPNGKIFYIGSVFATYTAQLGGTVYGIFADAANQKIWWTIDGSTWNNDVIGNQNPASNIGGVNPGELFQPAGTFKTVYPAFGSRSSGSAVTANFGASAFAYSIPAGGSAWGLP